MTLIKFNGNLEITIKDLVWLGVVLTSIVWTIAIMPQKVLSEVNIRYASREKVDMVCERLDRIEGKLDRLIETSQINRK
jgi:hypothetical protein